MFNWLKSTLAENSNANEDDVLETKKNLQKLDFYIPQKEAGETKDNLSKIPNKNLFDGIEQFQKENNLKVDRIMKPKGETENRIKQIKGAVLDLKKNYYDMKKDNTKNGADDYFHCKANFEATKRGELGERTAEYLGNIKEEFDYFKNRVKGK